MQEWGGQVCSSILGDGLEGGETEVRETSWEVVCAGVQGLSEQRCGDLN